MTELFVNAGVPRWRLPVDLRPPPLHAALGRTDQLGTLKKPLTMTERRNDCRDCDAVSDMLARIGDKWSIIVMVRLKDHPVRFNHLRRQVSAITQKILTTTLRNLERDGYVLRIEVPGRVRHVEYELTDLGRSVLRPMKALADWALANHLGIMEARARFDR